MSAAVLRLALVLACAIGADAARGQEAAPADPCAAAAGEAATIESVTLLGDVKLADGRLGRFADLDLGADVVSAGAWTSHLAAIGSVVAGAQVLIDDGGAFPDRWGRRPFRFSLQGAGGPSGSLHRALVEKGLARVAPLGEQDACAASLLAVEAEARSRGLGLWREPAARPLGAGERAAIAAMAGRFAIIEGRIISVGERPRRVYLNFGRDFSRDFAAALSLRAARLLEKAGIAPSSLRGRMVRVRGMVAARRAPAIEIVGPGQIEVVR